MKLPLKSGRPIPTKPRRKAQAQAQAKAKAKPLCKKCRGIGILSEWRDNVSVTLRCRRCRGTGYASGTKAKRKGKARGNTVPSNYSFDCWTLRYSDGSYEKSHDQRMHEAGIVAMYGDRDQAERTRRNKLPEHKPEIIRVRFSGRVEIVPAPAGKGGGA